MGFYDGLCFLRKEGFGIVIASFLSDTMRARIVPSSQHECVYDIELSEKLSKAERREEFIHECIHFGEPYRHLLGNMRELPEGEYGRIEAVIEMEAAYVARYHSRLITLLTSLKSINSPARIRTGVTGAKGQYT